MVHPRVAKELARMQAVRVLSGFVICRIRKRMLA